MTGTLLTSIGTLLGIIVAVVKLFLVARDLGKWQGTVDARLDSHDARHSRHDAAHRSLSRRVAEQGQQIDRHTVQLRHQASRITRLETGT